MSRKRQGRAIYPVRPIGESPNYTVEDGGEDRRGRERIILLGVFEDSSVHGWGVRMTRREARLLAKRILQCLEDTK